MKTIYYFLLTSIICTALGFTVPGNSRNLILSASDKNVSPELLTKSSEIISARLKIYNVEATVSVLPGKSQIKVQIPDDINVSDIEGLLTSKGNLGFYETLTLGEIAELSKNVGKERLSESRLACSSFENEQVYDSVENILKSVNLLSDFKLFWGVENSKSMTCIYAVKVNPVLTKEDIEIIKSAADLDSKSITIDIKFSPDAAKIWSATTKQNLNKPIAIVIDDKVFYTPVVKMAIESGLCEISGNFTPKEVNYFLALVNNETLPVDLILN
jgi:preprotein translocase subunit SecD